MPNLRIRTIPGSGDMSLPVTAKLFLRNGSAEAPLVFGEVVEVSDDEAEYWLASPLRDYLEVTEEEATRSFVTKLGALAPASSGDGIALSGDRLTAISRAIAKLQQEAAVDPVALARSFTDAGLPRVRAIEAELGEDITSEERDAAWELHTSSS